MLMRRQVRAVQVRKVTVEMSQFQFQFSNNSGGSQLCNREQMPQMQFRVATQRQIPVRVQQKIEFRCSCRAGSQVYVMEKAVADRAATR